VLGTSNFLTREPASERSGNNYIGGGVTNLTVGNTEIAARMIKKLSDLAGNDADGGLRLLGKGLSIQGGSVQWAESEIADWLRKSGLSEGGRNEYLGKSAQEL
jgi:hypothetical protein